MRKGKKAAEWMLLRVGSEAFPGMCKKFTRSGLDVPSKSLSARECWNNAKFKHKVSNKDVNTVPAFVPAFLDTGKFGHSVFTLNKDKDGNRLCISVDVKDRDNDSRREVGVVRLKDLLKWGPLQGWTEDFDGVRVVDAPAKKPAPAKPAPKPKAPAKPAPAPARKTVKQIAQEVVDGKWGNGADRKLNLERAGYPYAAVQHEVNELL